MRTLAEWCVRHRRLVVLFWFVALIGSIGLVTVAGTAYSNSFSFPSTQSADAVTLLQSVTPRQSGDREQVVFATSGSARLDDTGIGLRINEMVRQIDALPNVSPVFSPYDARGHLISLTNVNYPKDTVGFVNVTFEKQAQDISSAEATLFVHTAVDHSGDGLHIAVTGQLAEFAEQPVVQQLRLGRPSGAHRPPPGLRLGLRRPPPDHLRPLCPGNGGRRHRRAQSRHRHAVDLP